MVLYQNDSLKTGTYPASGYSATINIPTLEEPTFSLGSSLTSGYKTEGGYYISFVPTITDTHKVIKYGTYDISLKDEKGSVVRSKTGVSVNSVNNTITFDGLSSNTLYYIELNYETYRNNVGFTEEQKVDTIPFTDFTYTPIADDITLGTITAGQSTTKSVTLTYNGSSNLSDNIIRVEYTISLKGGSSKTTGTYAIGENNLSNIFTFGADKTPRLKIDTSDSNFSSNTGFTFKTGNTYIISTKYYYKKDGKETSLKDQVTDNDTFTTILNL